MQADFDGETYEPEREDDPGSDRDRLKRQLDCVRREMSDHNWHTLEELAAACHGSEAGVSARIRDLRKPKHGSNIVDRDYIGGGLHTYRLVPKPPPAPAPAPEPSRNPDPTASCTNCGAVRRVAQLSSKYGPPQRVGEIKGLRLWEAKCEVCDRNNTKGMQSIWKEQE